MPNYFELEELEALIPSTWLLGALDDDNNGTAEMFGSARQVAEDEINGLVGLRYTLPLDPVPTFIKAGALKLAAEVCYNRRGLDEQFPWKEQCAHLRTLLKDIAKGTLPLYPTSGNTGSKAKGEAKAYTEPSKIHTQSGRSNC